MIKAAKLLLICKALGYTKISVPKVLDAEDDVFNMVYFGCPETGGISLRGIYEELQSKGAI